MSEQNLCPKCGSTMLRNAKSCPCGWGRLARRTDDDNDRTCAYQSNGLRCKFPGAISHGILGGGPWYCRIHIREGGNALAWQCLEQSQRYQAKRPPEDDLEGLTWLTENFPMHPDETRQEYNLRCRAKAMSALKGFRPKPVLDTEPGRMREPGEDLVEL